MAGALGKVRAHPWLFALAVLLVLLLVVRIALPSIIERIVEGKLETMPGGYQGTVEDVDVRGLFTEIALRGFTITKKNGQIPVPFLKAEEFVLMFELDGYKPRTVMRYVKPEFSWVDAESEAKKQLGPQKMIETLRQKLPFELIRVEVEDGIAHFRNYQTKPDMDLFARDIDLVWDHLVGCLPPGNSACRSQMQGSLDLLKSGKVKLKGRFARNPVNDFHVTAHVRNLRAPELNPFLNEYVKVKMTGGTIELDVRYDRRGERHDALFIPLLSDVEVAKADGEDASFLRKVGVGLASGWFERKKGDKGIAITKKPGGETSFEIVDKPSVKNAEDARADD